MAAQTSHPRKTFRSARGLVARLREIKGCFSPEARRERLAALEQLRRTKILEAKTLLEYHELLLFIRAYPDDDQIFQLVQRECAEFGPRVSALRRADADAAEKLEDTGMPRTGMYYSYDYPTAASLVQWYGDDLEIDWEGWEQPEKVDSLLPLFSEWVENDGLDLADISTRQWIELRKGERSSLRWLLENLKRSIPGSALRRSLYDGLDIPVVWRLGDSPACRSREQAPCGTPFFHGEGLLRRVPDFRAEVARPLPAIRPAPPRLAGGLIRTVRSALAVRHRSLWPIGYANRAEVLAADVGRGYQIVLLGMRPEDRLPIESNYGVLVLKNGFVFGYGLGAPLFDQVEIAVNIFDSFRGGESAFVFAQFLRVFHSLFGCSRFKLERYQAGHENEEGLQSGAFWFFYRLGFVPRDLKVRRLALKEQAKINRNRTYRSSIDTLRKLASSDLYLRLEGDPESIPPDFPLAELSLKTTRMIGDRFAGDGRQAARACAEEAARSLGRPRWRSWPAGEREWFQRLALIIAQIPNLNRWPERDKRELERVMRAKGKPQEAEYVRRLRGHRRLQKALEALARS